MRRFNRRFLALLVLTALASPALAHSGHDIGQLGAFFGGISHPFTGLDHFLAMLAVGVVAARRASAISPLCLVFITGMLVGGMLGLAAFALPAVETGVASSVVMLGGAILFAPRLHAATISALVLFFAVFHGFAHGVEMPLTNNAAAYFGGFATGTAILHLAGFTFARLLQNRAFSWWPGVISAGTAGAGVMLLVVG